MVELFPLKEGKREAKKVISISRYENPSGINGEAELLLIGKATSVDLMDGDDIKAETATNLGHRRT